MAIPGHTCPGVFPSMLFLNVFISSASTWFKVYIASVETFIFLLIIFFSQYTGTQTTSPWCWDPGVVLPECRRLLFPFIARGYESLYYEIINTCMIWHDQ